MMNSETQALIKREPDIPGLFLLLNASAFTDKLQSCFPAARIQTGKLHYVRYKPGTSCLASFDIQINDEKVRVSAKAFNKNTRDKIEKARIKQTPKSPIASECIILEDLNVVISFFPNDAKLRTLPKLFRQDKKRSILKKLLPTQPNLWEGAIQILKYNAERRCVVALEAQGGVKVLLKCHRPERLQSALMNATAICSQKELLIPKCLGFSEDHGLIVSEWIDGAPLDEMIHRDFKQAIAVTTQIGRALATLHAMKIGHLCAPPRARISTELHSMAEMIACLSPKRAKPSEDLKNQLMAWLLKAPQIERTIHGDFSSHQILCSDQGNYLLDFDQARLGNPSEDLGHFIAHLELEIIAGRIGKEQLLPLSKALLNGYMQVSEKSVPNEIIWHTAKSLFLLAQTPFRSNSPNWDNKIESILNRVQRLIHDAPHRGSALLDPSHLTLGSWSRTQAFNPLQDAAMPFISQAMDPFFITPHLLKLPAFSILDEGDLSVKKCRLIRYKPRRRCLIEYEIEIKTSENSIPRRLTLIGKISAKGRQDRAYLLNNKLWMACFKKATREELSIPESLGVVPECQMWLQKKVAGDSATNVLMRPGGISIAKRIANAILKFHSLNIEPKRTHTMDDELRILADRFEKTKQTHPDFSDRLDRIFRVCRDLASSLPKVKYQAIHRDFYADQVIVDGPRLYLIDFDLYCLGDPALDIGNFLGHLTEQALRCLNDAQGLSECEAALEDQFLARAPHTSRQSIQSYKTLTLARHIYISTQFEERRAFTLPLLALCESRLNISSRAQTVSRGLS